MSKTGLLLCLLAIIGFGGSDANAPKSEVVLISLTNPIYPQPAKAARVAGDVELNLNIRTDGTVESADVIAGPMMLRQAALDSVQQSRFECLECSENVTTYRMVFNFQLVSPECRPDSEVKTAPTYPQVIQSHNRVAVIDQTAAICDPVGTITKVRSLKCLFLWKCSKRYPL